jgi:predicted NBD/HSP70 family sugar kinase
VTLHEPDAYKPGDDAGRGSGVGEILTLFRHSSSLTRADVARRTGLSRATVNLRLDALVSAGLLLPAGEGLPTRGRPAEHFAFNAASGVLLVADIGATGMRTAMCDLAGQILGERSAVTDVTDGPEIVLKVVQGEFGRTLADAGQTSEVVRGIALCVPGPVDTAAGRVISPPIMTGWDRYDIPGWFAAHYDCPVIVDKDVNAMAIGEQRTHHPGVANLLMLKVGTGVGAGIITGGGIYRGADGAAGDIGHNPVPHPEGLDDQLCRCGNTGCVEAYAGGWALVRDLRADGNDITTVDEALALVRAGHPTAVRLSRRSGRILGVAISDAVNLLNPRVVVVGGQLARVEQHLIAGIREVVYRRSLPLATRHLEIVTSRLDPRAGVVGLTLLLADRIFDAARINQLVSP